MIGRPSRSLRVGALAVLAVLVLWGARAVAGDGTGDGGGRYLVRATFDNASFLVTGEDVKVAGVVVGTIERLELDRRNHAVAVLRIDDPAFRPFRTDARCSIGLQSLIGEQFVDCKATQPRAAGRPPAPALARIPEGQEGAGQHLLPVEQTSSPVGIDLLANIQRLPQRERLRLIVAELGAGVAGNGEQLRRALIRANPALQQADRVLAVLADQNRLLDRLVADSDAAIAPLARRRADLGASIDRIGRVAAAAAERGGDLERDIARLPAFLRELDPAMRRLATFARQATPTVREASAGAPALAGALRRVGAFADAGIPAVRTLGALAQRGRTTFPRIRPLVDRLAATATPLQPVARDLGGLLGSFERAGGLESLLQLLYFYTGALNGADERGHYLRANLLVTQCIDRKYVVVGFCRSDLTRTSGAGAAQTRSALQRILDRAPLQPALPTSESVARERAVLARRDPDAAAAAAREDVARRTATASPDADSPEETGPHGTPPAGDRGGRSSRDAIESQPGDDPERTRRALEALLGPGGRR